MHIKRIHEMVEKLTECALRELNKGVECVDTKEFGEVVDAIKDLCEAEKEALISKEMKEYKEEEEAEQKYMMRMLKDEHKDEYKRMREEYGEEDGERRFYDNYRYKSSGRFAPKGRGTRYGRRGYEEPMYHMMPDMYREHDPEYWRDLDREQGKLYYTPMSGGNMGGSGNTSGGSSGGDTRSYSEGYNDGNRRGYSEGYERGMNDGRRSGGDSRFERAKRGYEETKKSHNGNTPEDKKMNMAEFEKVLNIALDEIEDMLEDAPPEMKNMAKTKGMARLQKIS